MILDTLKPRSEEDRRIVSPLLILLPLTFSTFVGGLIVWVIHLIRTSLEWNDVVNASIGISLVALPVFVLMLGVFNYLFWGLLRNRS